ncbi:MAG: NADH-quinone oxidoreductase subunit N [Chloroflexi bacterium]|nr:NADH-quinone oxidoreductase subunit N [Chloroflexota bacterium]
MSASDLIALLPLIVLSSGAVVMMLVIAFRRDHALTAGITLVILALAFLANFLHPGGTVQVTPLLIIDGFTVFMVGLLLAASFVIVLLGYGYFRVREIRPEEFYLLLVLATLGACVLAASSHFVSLFIGLEILSISLYAMIGYSYHNALTVEAGMKYLLLAASSAAFLLFGMALIYFETGTMVFGGADSGLGAAAGSISIVMLAGLVMMLVGFGYKLALVPFHLWTPDVYEGAPAPVTAFVASISKGSVFAVLLRFFLPFDVTGRPALLPVFLVIAIVTMLAGSLLALLQTNLKRLLAYSSIANLGYLLVAFMATGASAITAAIFFLVSYFVTILAAFGVVTALSSRSRDADMLDDYYGLMWRHPWLAAVLAVSMFSLAGIPLTVGFLGKFYVILASIGSSQWLLAVVLVISSAIGLFYYLRVVVALFSPAEQATRPPAVVAQSGTLPSGQMSASSAQPIAAYSTAGWVALAVLLVLLFILGILPDPLIDLINRLVSGGI